MGSCWLFAPRLRPAAGDLGAEEPVHPESICLLHPAMFRLFNFYALQQLNTFSEPGETVQGVHP